MGRYVFRLPDVGEGTAEAEIVAWHVAVGQVVEEDQPLLDVMTDKATVEMTSPVAGTITQVIGALGENAAVGSPIVVLEVEGAGDANERVEAPSPAAEVHDAAPTAPLPAQPAPAQVAPAPAPEGVAASPRRAAGERPAASPSVRRRAEELGVRLAFVPGSGPAGRILHEDLDAFVASDRVFPANTVNARRTAVEEVKVIGLRRKIAERMQEAKRRIPHFAYVEEVDMTEVEDLRTHLNETNGRRSKLTVLPFIIRALVQVLPSFPQINAHYDDAAGVVRRHGAVHAGIATQTANGLVVPVIRHAEALDLWAAAAEIARLSTAARENKATSEELSGSTITITSLGRLGGVATTPVINAPEVAIIGPNKIIERPVVRRGQVVVRKMMNLSSSFDHRVVDGYDAAEFIQRVKDRLEHPATLFID